MASSKTITLISSDGETFDLDVVAAMESQLIKGTIEDGCADNGIPLPNVTSEILAKVIEYCKKHVETPKAEEHAWAADFFKDDQAAFFDLIKAADYLRIESLLDLACQTVVDMTKEMSPAEICEIYVSIKEKSLEKISERYNIKTGLTLKSSDSKTFDLDVAVATESQKIKRMIKDRRANNAILDLNVTSKILAMVIEYCKKHAINDKLKDFVKVDRTTLLDLINAADYLRIESLLDLARQTVVDMTKEMSLAEKCEIYVSIKEKSLDNAFLPNVTSKTLAMVIEYCKKHVETPEAEEHAVNDELKAWDADFVKVDQATLFDLINAANYLDIKSLLDLTCQTLSDMTQEMSGNEIYEIYLLIKERSLQKICKIYNIETKLTLQSSDGELFYVDVAVAMESQTIKHMIEDGCADHAIPVPNVTSQILARVIEYCKKHVETPRAKEHAVNDELKAWDADFVKVDRDTVLDLVLAADYLEITSLLDLTCQTVADMIKGRAPAEIEKMFKFQNDFTPEEEEEVRRENAWAFERDDEWVFE